MNTLRPFGLAFLLVGLGVLVGMSLTAPAATAQATWQSCILADVTFVDGNNPAAMTSASGETRLMVPAGYEPVGGFERGVVLCRH